MTDPQQTRQIAEILLTIGAIFLTGPVADLLGRHTPVPQAGVALGLALMAARAFPELENLILPTVFGSTVLFGLVGSVGTRFALRRAGEAA